MAKGRKRSQGRGTAEDVVLLCGRTEDGAGLDVIRKRGEVLQRGVVRPLEEGKPISGEVVKLQQRGDSMLFDVTVHCTVGTCTDAAAQPAVVPPAEPSAEAITRGHPARVASDDYRRNWDAIWKRSPGKALPN